MTRAGTPAQSSDLVDVDALLAAYHDRVPDLDDPAQRVVFGTSGHRGSSLDGAFTDTHIAAITQAIVEYRATQGTTGPIFVGADTHALSIPAQRTALEVLTANGVAAFVDANDGYVPTPRSATRSSPTTAAASPTPTASSSRRATTLPATAASSTTLRKAARPTPMRRTGSRTARTTSSPTARAT